MNLAQSHSKFTENVGTGKQILLALWGHSWAQPQEGRGEWSPLLSSELPVCLFGKGDGRECARALPILLDPFRGADLGIRLLLRLSREAWGHLSPSFDCLHYHNPDSVLDCGTRTEKCVRGGNRMIIPIFYHPLSFILFKKIFSHSFIWPPRVLVAARGIFSCACRLLVVVCGI